MGAAARLSAALTQSRSPPGRRRVARPWHNLADGYSAAANIFSSSAADRIEAIGGLTAAVMSACQPVHGVTICALRFSSARRIAAPSRRAAHGRDAGCERRRPSISGRPRAPPSPTAAATAWSDRHRGFPHRYAGSAVRFRCFAASVGIATSFVPSTRGGRPTGLAFVDRVRNQPTCAQ
jgi:hypothetical protein